MDLDSSEEARKLVSRSILCRSVYELYASGTSVEELHEKTIRNKSQWEKYNDVKTSFKFEFVSYKGSRDQQEQIKIIESFSFMGLEGPIRMKKPDVTFSIVEEYIVKDSKPEELPKRVWFGRFITDSDRSAMDRLDLKRRRYIGTTTFDAELSLVTCNIAQVSPGKIVYDPFCGTGSFLVAGGYMGALTCGSDIDVRMLRGNGKDRTIDANFRQYGIQNKYLDVMTMDFTHNAFRNNLFFDAIICDPPYGVREGLKVLGAKDEEKFLGKETVMIEGVAAHLRKDYVPTKKPYELYALLDDLLAFAAIHLKPGGRLCYWMPVANEDFKEHHIPLHEDLKLLSCCIQDFNKCKFSFFIFL